MRQASITDNRTDMTGWIIHFTRNHDALSAHQSLERILYTGKLKPGYSIRKDKTTLYGVNRLFVSQKCLSTTLPNTSKVEKIYQVARHMASACKSENCMKREGVL